MDKTIITHPKVYDKMDDILLSELNNKVKYNIINKLDAFHSLIDMDLLLIIVPMEDSIYDRIMKDER